MHIGALALALTGLVTPILVGADLSDTPSTPHHNVVLIAADDMRADDIAFMPKTRALLGGEGATFELSYASTPLCCPTRATLLTGQYSHNHGVATNKPQVGQGYLALDHAHTVPVWLRAAGFDTIFMGKYLNGYGQYGYDPAVADKREIPPGWSDWQALVGNLRYRAFELNVNGRIVTYPRTATSYQTDTLAERAAAAIVSRSRSGTPFYLWIAPLAPHMENGAPPVPAPRHAHAFDGLELPTPPNFNEEVVSDKPAFVRTAPLLSDDAIAKLRAHYEARAETLLAVDDLVERVYRTLEAQRLLDTTMIVFTSDNGYMLGNHRLEGKIKIYEESSRVPLLIRGGAFSGGTSYPQPVTNVDLVPTMLAWLGVAPQLPSDGVDLADLVAAPADYDDRAVLMESLEWPRHRALRTADWLWVHYEAGKPELYDMANDPYQLTSLHQTPSAAAVREQLKAVLNRIRNCSGAGCQASWPAVSP